MYYSHRKHLNGCFICTSIVLWLLKTECADYSITLFESDPIRHSDLSHPVERFREMGCGK